MPYPKGQRWTAEQRARVTRPMSERFWAQVDTSGGPEACHPWTGATNAGGYGVFTTTRGKTIQASRFAFEDKVRPLRPGEFALHHCDNPPCCNTGPHHIFAGTNDENMADMVQKQRQARGSGHGLAKLSEADIPAIRAMRRDGVSPQRIANTLGVSRWTIRRILAGEMWGHIDG